MNLAEESPTVMHVITGLDIGGAETQLLNLVCSRKSSGIVDNVICMVPDGMLLQQFKEIGVPVYELNMKRGRPSIMGLIRLLYLIYRLKPKIIQSWMYHADLLATVALFLSGRRRLTKLIWGIRCSNMNLKNYRRSLQWIIKICASCSYLPDIIIANSQVGLNVHKSLGYTPRCSDVMPNGIDTDRFIPDDEARIRIRNELGISNSTILIAQIARVDPMKDHEMLLKATSQLSGIEVVLAGLGTEKFSSWNGVHALGQRSDVPALLAACDFVISSSAYGEGFSNALAEGMSTGLPAIATNVGDASEIIGDTGLITPPSDDIKLREAIYNLVNEDPALHSQRKIRARDRIVESFSLSESTKRYGRLYQSLY